MTTNKEKEQTMESKEELIQVPNITRQLVFSKLAHASTNSHGVDVYFLYQAVEGLRAGIGDQVLKDKFKEKFPAVEQRLNKIAKHAFKIKVYYDSLGNKELDEMKMEKEIERLFRDDICRLIDLKPFKLMFYILNLYIEKTNLKFQTIPNSYFKKSERKYSTFDLKKTDEDDDADESE